MKKHKIAALILIVTAIAFLTLTNYAYAGNGSRMLGFSARDSGMGGATTASPEDTSCLVRNPAGLVRIGNRIDVEYMNIMPNNVTMDTEGPAASTLPNKGLKQDNTIGYIPGGNGGVSYRIPGTDEHPISVGLGAFTMSGLGLNYPSSRMNSAITGDYDKMMNMMSMRIAPGIAVAFNGKLSFGVTGNIDIQGLRTNLGTAPTFAETAGGGNWDFTGGGGFNIGILYKLCDMLGLGASYESHQWMGHHYKYKDCLPYIDEPPVINVGLSFKPTKNFEWTYDTRYVNWTDVKIARLTPANGGFGWRDQWVFATGGEYSFMDKKGDDKLKLRLGYMYGKSPIQPHFVFANAIMPLIFEHHLTAGFSYFLTRNFSLDLAWEHGFKSVMSDDGAGDIYSIDGNGTKITAAVDIIGVGIGYKF
jgi:long-chain fatty acid transport protein